jgi:hypothetical protein
VRNRLKSRLAAAVLGIVLGCGGDGTGNSGGGIPVADVTGAWSVTLADSLPCPDTLPESTINFAITGTEDDVEPAGSLTFSDSWSTIGGLTGTVYGTVNLEDRSVILHFTRQDSLGYAMEVRGRLDNAMVLRGGATDPYAGHAPLLITGSCVFKVSGSRS